MKIQECPALLIGLALFAGALVLRLLGIGWGLPNDLRNQSLHPDELVVWSYSQQIEPTKLDFDPEFYNYGTLYLTMMRVATDVVNAYGGGPALRESMPEDEAARAQWQAIGRYHLAGRVLNALAGAGTVWVVFLLLYRRTHLVGAVLGALAVMLAPGHVVHSRFQTVDVMAAFFVALSLYWALRLVPLPDPEQEPSAAGLALRWALLAGLFAGLSAGTKYSGILVLVALAVAVFARPKPERMKLAAAGFAVAVLAFVATTPGMLKNTSQFVKDFVYEIEHTSTGHGLVFAGTPSGFVYHLGNLGVGMGWMVLALGLIGLGWAVWQRRLEWVAVALFALLTYVLLGRAEVKFFRYVLPLMPAVAVGFGWLMGEAHVHAEKRMKAWVVAGILGLGGMLGGGLVSSVLHTAWMLGPDPRDEAGQGLSEYGQTLGLVQDPWFWSITVSPDMGLPPSVPLRERLDRVNATSSLKVSITADSQGNVSYWNPSLLDSEPDLIAFTSFESDDLERLDRMQTVPEEFRGQVEQFRAFRERLRAEYDLIRTVGGGGPTVHDLMYVRPYVWVWKRKDFSSNPETTSSTTSEP